MSKTQKYILEQLKEMNVLGTIHSYIKSAKYSIEKNNIEASIEDLAILKEYIESLQDILMILPMFKKTDLDNEY